MKKQNVVVVLIAIMIAVFGMVAIANSADKPLTFGWGQAAVDLPQLDKWTLYYSETAGGPYTKITDILYVSEQDEYQHTETITIVGDGEEKTIYFVLTATDKESNESDYSNEVNKLIDFKAPNVPITFTIVIN